MMINENEPARRDQEDRDVSEIHEPSKPNAYRVEDDHNLEEKDLKRHYLFGEGKMKDINAPGMEGQGMGGHQFGENNLTPAGNDKANPPQNAGEGNAYFRRTEPSEEHPENSNFKVLKQEGEPDYSQAQPDMDEDYSSPAATQKYQEGTADDDGPKKERDHIET